MKRRFVTLWIAAAIVAFTVSSLGAASRGQLSTNSADIDFTELIVPVRQETAAKAISGLSSGTLGLDAQIALPGKYASYQLANFQSPLFPVDVWLRQNTRDNPALRRYVETPPEARQHDLYLFSPAGSYWPSAEYVYEGRPAPFSCSFIIHLESKGASTAVEVIEYLPRVVMGRTFAWSAHTGQVPQLFANVQPVPPTSTERIELLSELKKVLLALPDDTPPRSVERPSAN